MVLNSHPVLVPQIAAWPHGVRPPPLGRRHEILSVGNQNQRGLARRDAERLDPDVNLGSGTVCLAPGRPPPLPNNRDGANTWVKSRTSTPQPQRRSMGSLEKGPPVPLKNLIKQLFLAHSFNVSQEFWFTRGSTASHAAGTCIHSAGTFPLDQKQGLVFFSRLARWKRCWLGFPDVVVRDSIDHKAGAN